MWRGRAQMLLGDLKTLLAELEKESSMGRPRLLLLNCLAASDDRSTGLWLARRFLANAERLADVHIRDDYASDSESEPECDEMVEYRNRETEIVEWCAEAAGSVEAARRAHSSLTRLWGNSFHPSTRATEDEIVAAVDIFKTALEALQLQFEKLFPSRRTVITRMLLNNELNARERSYLLSTLSA